MVFKLASVPDVEAEGVKKALTEAGIDFYETPPGRWGISMHALWVRNDDDFAPARKVIDQFQEEYVRQLKASGVEPDKPNVLKILVAVAVSAVILYFFNYFWIAQWL